MSVEVMTWVWNNSRSKGTSRLVLLAIADCARADGSHAFPSNPEIRRKANASERAVQDSVKALIELGELEVQYNAGPKGVNLYRVIMTPAGSAPRRIRTPAESAGGKRKARSKPNTPQNLHPPAESAPPQNLPVPPAESAPGTVMDPSGTTEVLRTSAATPPAKPSKHETADALAARFWEIHKGNTAQPFLAVRSVIRTAIGNGIPRDDVARALDRLAREGRAISGGTITTALGQIRNGPSLGGYAPRPSTTDLRLAELDAATERVKAQIYGNAS